MLDQWPPLPRPVLESHLVSDLLADVAANFRCHTLSKRLGGQTSEAKHHSPSVNVNKSPGYSVLFNPEIVQKSKSTILFSDDTNVNVARKLNVRMETSSGGT